MSTTGENDDAADKGDMQSQYIYTGQDRSNVPRNVKCINVHPSVKILPTGLFCDLYQLVRVKLHDGLMEIGKHAFENCRSLQRIHIPDSVQIIGWAAFNGCKSLQMITIPAGIKEIHDMTFQKCSQLQEIIFASPSCVELTHIGNRAFKGCSLLKSVKIPNSVKVIDKGAFEACERLEDIELCEGLEEIQEKAFLFCNALKRIKIPRKVHTIGEEAFCNCQHLEEIEFCEGSSLEELGAQAFCACHALKSIKIPSTVRLIGEWQFRHCYELTEVSFSENSQLKQLNEGVFLDCKSLRRIKLPFTIESLGDEVFSGCRLLISVELGNRVGKFLDSAFKNCYSLRNIAIHPGSISLKCFEPGCHDLLKLFGTSVEVDSELQCRFDGLPIHMLCYQQAYKPTEETMRKLLQPCSVSDWPEAAISDNSQDCLGMTPLHILACSSKHDLALYRLMVNHQPASLVTMDKWGCIPALYAIWLGAPHDVVKFLVSSQKAAFPDHAVCWESMIETLCRAGAPLDSIQTMLEIQQLDFTELSVDWHRVAQFLTIHCSLSLDFFGSWQTMLDAFRTTTAHHELIPELEAIQIVSFPNQNDTNWQHFREALVPLKGWWRPTSKYESIKIYRYVVKCDLPDRLNGIGVRKWRVDIAAMIEESSKIFSARVPRLFDDIHSQLRLYEYEYGVLKTASYLLELALWKCKMIENGKYETRSNESNTDTDDANLKVQSRIHCGASVIIPNVLPYLIPECKRKPKSSMRYF